MPHSNQGLKKRLAISHDHSLQRPAISKDQQFTAASVPSNQRPQQPASAAITFRSNQRLRRPASSKSSDHRSATTSSSQRPAFPATSVHSNQRPPRSHSADFENLSISCSNFLDDLQLLLADRQQLRGQRRAQPLRAHLRGHHLEPAVPAAASTSWSSTTTCSRGHHPRAVASTAATSTSRASSSRSTRPTSTSRMQLHPFRGATSGVLHPFRGAIPGVLTAQLST